MREPSSNCGCIGKGLAADTASPWRPSCSAFRRLAPGVNALQYTPPSPPESERPAEQRRLLMAKQSLR